MNRVRFGLTGFAFIFLLFLSGTALFAPESPEADGAAAPPNDTLATLGVAPGGQEPGPAAPDVLDGQGLEPVPGPPVEDLLEDDPLSAIPLPKVDAPATRDDLTEI